MNILVIGSGGREHALVWKISQSPKVDKIYCAPGSDAIGERAECVDIAMQAPTGTNAQNWAFVVVTDPAKLVFVEQW